MGGTGLVSGRSLRERHILEGRGGVVDNEEMKLLRSLRQRKARKLFRSEGDDDGIL